MLLQRCPHGKATNITLTDTNIGSPFQLLSWDWTLTNITVAGSLVAQQPALATISAGITINNQTLSYQSGAPVGYGNNKLINPTVNGAYNFGIRANNTNDLQIIGGHIRNIWPGVGGGTHTAAIELLSDINPLVTDLRIDDLQTSPTTYYGVQDSTNTNAQYINILTTNTTTPWSTSGSTGAFVWNVSGATSALPASTALGTPVSGTLTNVTGLPIGGISATGTPDSGNYLRGDGTWSTPATGGAALSFQAQCTGTIGTASLTNYSMNFGTCSATTAAPAYSMPTACTAQNLNAVATAVGAVSGSGIVTLYRAVATTGTPSFGATSITCTLGTGTSCSDTTHTVSFAAGDRWQFKVETGQATDTTANVGATFTCQ